MNVWDVWNEMKTWLSGSYVVSYYQRNRCEIGISLVRKKYGTEHTTLYKAKKAERCRLLKLALEFVEAWLWSGSLSHRPPPFLNSLSTGPSRKGNRSLHIININGSFLSLIAAGFPKHSKIYLSKVDNRKIYRLRVELNQSPVLVQFRSTSFSPEYEN